MKMFRTGQCFDDLEKIKNHIITQNINDICAACLQQHENYRTSSMRDTLLAQDQIPVYKILESISLFKYSMKTPQLLCTTCSYKLLTIYEFQQMLNKSYFYYNNYINHKDKQDTYELELGDAGDPDKDTEIFNLSNDSEGSLKSIEKSFTKFQASASTQLTFSEGTTKVCVESEDPDVDNYDCKLEIEDTEIHYLSSEGNVKSIEKGSTEIQASTSTELTFLESSHLQDSEEHLAHSEGTAKISLGSEIVRAGTIEGNGVANESTRIKDQAGLTIELTEHGANPKDPLGLDKKEKCIEPRKGRVTEFVCTYCKKARKKQALIFYENLHTGEKPYKCEKCTRAFTLSQLLELHKVTRNPKRFGCELCVKTFKQKGNLNQHLKLHTNPRPHVCSRCNKGFNWKCQLMRHAQSHNKKDYKISVRGPFTCDQCPKTYTTRSGLKYHELCHRAERSFVCNICAKTFRTRAHLSQHAKCHARSHVCSICGKDFATKHKLMTHMRRLHNNGDNKPTTSVKKSQHT